MNCRIRIKKETQQIMLARKISNISNNYFNKIIVRFVATNSHKIISQRLIESIIKLVIQRIMFNRVVYTVIPFAQIKTNIFPNYSYNYEDFAALTTCQLI
jgi:hypothetical protein